jgi:hypothetical protein
MKILYGTQTSWDVVLQRANVASMSMEVVPFEMPHLLALLDGLSPDDKRTALDRMKAMPGAENGFGA